MGLVNGAPLVHVSSSAQHAEHVHTWTPSTAFVRRLGALKDVILLVPVWACTFSLLPRTLSVHRAHPL